MFTILIYNVYNVYNLSSQGLGKNYSASKSLYCYGGNQQYSPYSIVSYKVRSQAKMQVTAKLVAV